MKPKFYRSDLVKCINGINKGHYGIVLSSSKAGMTEILFNRQMLRANGKWTHEDSEMVFDDQLIKDNTMLNHFKSKGYILENGSLSGKFN